MIITLLIFVSLSEAAAAFVLILQRPVFLYRLLSSVLDNAICPLSAVHIKRFAPAIAVALLPILFRIFRIRRRIAKAGSSSVLLDQFMLQTYLLEAFLIGLSIYLFLIVSLIHSQVCEIQYLRSTVKRETNNVVNGGKEEHLQLNSKQEHNDELITKTESALCQEISSLKETVSDLKKRIEALQLVAWQKDEEVKAAESNTKALQKQSEGFLLEYDRLLEDNQNLRTQLSLLDRKLTHSESFRKMS